MGPLFAFSAAQEVRGRVAFCQEDIMAANSGTKSVASYFTYAVAFTVIGLALSAWLGWETYGTVGGMLNILFIASVLAVLEVSLSFDNAIVNANKLRTMTPEWQHRFLTWGILIAVFGMRIVFPLAIVVVAADMGPLEALHLASKDPHKYAEIIEGAGLSISAFGGTFLMMVALDFFCDDEKHVHWLSGIERIVSRVSGAKFLTVAVVLGVVALVAGLFEGPEAFTFLTASVWGLLTFLVVDVVSDYLEGDAKKTTAQVGLSGFLYLEVLDASFSFDGVIGAFALTQNLYVIAIGLGIGAMFVRSMTILLVDRGTLTEYRFLEHGAFYSILVLSLIMFAHVHIHVPEVVTGLIGAGLIGASLFSSLRYKRLHWDES